MVEWQSLRIQIMSMGSRWVPSEKECCLCSCEVARAHVLLLCDLQADTPLGQLSAQKIADAAAAEDKLITYELVSICGVSIPQ